MRVITQKTVGDASVLEVAEVAKPVPGPGQVLVAVRAAGVNPVETFYRVWSLAAGRKPGAKASRPAPDRPRAPRLSEPWFC